MMKKEKDRLLMDVPKSRNGEKMIYPKFLKENNTIGICAPSAGIGEEKAKYFEKSLENIKKEGYQIKETTSVRNEGLASNTGKIRGEEFNELVNDETVNMIWSASGGDMLVEMLDYVEDEALLKNPKWIAGYSDPTTLLFHITTNLDIATLYGNNAGSFDMNELHPSLINSLEIIKGNLVKQESFEMCERNRFKSNFESKEVDGQMLLQDEQGKNTQNKNEEIEFVGYNLDSKVEWKTPNGPVDISGRLIGGCIDCLNFIIGTKYDGTKKFIEKYKDDGVIWYFDNFALKSEDLFFTLWHMKQAGWFEYVKGFVFGRTLFEGTFLDMSYEEAIKRVLGEEIPIIIEADIGHVAPKFTVINGAMGRFIAKEGRGSLEMWLKE